jgi:hypothetical protein
MHESTTLRVFGSADETVLYCEQDEQTVIVEHGSRGPTGAIGPTGIGTSFQCFSAPGTLSIKTGKGRFYAPADFDIVGLTVSCGTAPVGQSIVVDINKNGSTIYTNQANRPSISGSNFYALATIPNITSISAGDYITVDIDQVGLTFAGSDLTVVLQLNES